MIATKNQNVIKILLLFLSLVMVLHLLILVKIIPYEITWGGRLKNDSEMYVFESISLGINFFLAWVLLMKGRLVNYKFSPKIVDLILWAFVILFLLNTVGNIFAKTWFEKSFTILTLSFAVLIGWILIRGKKKPAV